MINSSIFSITLPNTKTVVDLFVLNNPGTSIDNYMIESSLIKNKFIPNPEWTEGSDVPQTIKNDGLEYWMPKGNLIIMSQAIYPFYKLCKRYSNRVIEELSDYYKGVGMRPLDISQSDFELLEDYYAALGKDSPIESWLKLYEIMQAIIMLNSTLVGTGIIYKRELRDIL